VLPRRKSYSLRPADTTPSCLVAAIALAIGIIAAGVALALVAAVIF